MYKLLILLLIFNSNILQSQEKKTYYFESDSHEISKNMFIRNTQNQKFITQTFEIDTAYISVSFKRKNYGQLSKIEMQNLKADFYELGKQEDDDKNLILIHYYPGSTYCNRSAYPSLWTTNDSKYIKRLNKLAPLDAFFIYRNDELLDDSYFNEFQWYKDKNQIVEKQFFKYIFPCGSFVVISNSGEYISYYGEYGKQTVFDFTKELIKNIEKDTE